MELEYVIHVILENGDKERIRLWIHEDFSNNELMAKVHDLVITKFGAYRHN